MTEIKTKKCSKCGEVKTLDNFGKNKRSKDGLRYSCRECENSIRRKQNNNNNYKRAIINKSLLKKGMKVCSRCGESKSLSEFYKAKDKPSGYRSLCKACINLKERNKYKENTPIKIEEILPKGFKRCSCCKMVLPFDNFYKNSSSKDGYTCHCKKCNSKKSLNYVKKNREKITKKRRYYREKNREIINIKYKEYIRKRYIEDPEFKMKSKLRKNLLKAVKRQRATKYSHSVELLGCDLNTVKDHLEKSFYNRADGTPMTWDLFLNGKGCIHIDHIKPCASFDLTKESEQKKCFHYTNLQLLWAEDNISKSDSLGWIHPIKRKIL